MVIINHERFGEKQEFDSLQEAQAAIRECGPEFAGVQLMNIFGAVYDLDRWEIVGKIPEEDELTGMTDVC